MAKGLGNQPNYQALEPPKKQRVVSNPPVMVGFFTEFLMNTKPKTILLGSLAIVAVIAGCIASCFMGRGWEGFLVVAVLVASLAADD